MSQDIIREFLVSLGFQTDKKGAKDASLTLTGLQNTAVSVVKNIQLASLAVQGFATIVASNLDKVYFASQRVNSSVSNISALGYAFRQVGLDAGTANSAIESLNSFIQSSPYARNYLSQLGVSTTNSLGQLKDTGEILTDLLTKLSKMPHYQGVQYAKIFGIDEKTLFAVRNGLTQFTEEYQEMLRITGHDSDQAAVQSNRYMDRMRAFTSLLGIIRDRIGSQLANGLTDSLESLRKLILDNYPKIEKVLLGVLRGIIKTGEYFTRLLVHGINLIDKFMTYYNNLDATHQRTIQVLGAMAVAVWALSSPLMIVAGLLAGLLLLYDDYATYQRGGKSYFDWSSLETYIDSFSQSMDDLIKNTTKELELIVEMFKYVKAIIDYTKRQGNELNQGESEIIYNRIVGGEDNFEEFRNKFSEYSLNSTNLGVRSQPDGFDGNLSESSSSVVNLNQNNNITINTTSDPETISNTLSGSIDRTNERVIRNIRGTVE